MKKLGFGMMRLPLTDGDDYSAVDIERVKKMADMFLASGSRSVKRWQKGIRGLLTRLRISCPCL